MKKSWLSILPLDFEIDVFYLFYGKMTNVREKNDVTLAEKYLSIFSKILSDNESRSIVTFILDSHFL